MTKILEPIKNSLKRQHTLLTQEQQRVELMWRRQLSRQQGLKPAQQKQQSDLKTKQVQIEQKQRDDLNYGYFLRKR